MKKENMVVMLTTEGTYPFHQGGVSTWCDLLVNRLSAVDYIIYSIIMDPYVTQKFKLPSGTDLIKLPLWGTEEPSEHLRVPFAQVYASKLRTLDKVIDAQFIPLFEAFIRHIISEDKSPIQFAHILLELHKYFQKYEYKVSFRSELTWGLYKKIIAEAVAKQEISQPDVYGLIQSIGWVYRFFHVLNTPIPKAHVSHASAAAFCGIPCVLAKLLHNTPFLLTEHGIYLREQYLSLSKRGYSAFLNTFLIRLIHSVTSLNYTFADQVSPVCAYNTRWERRFGVSDDRIEVIYNGIDQKIFKEGSYKPKEVPTVVTVARIDPIKDILTLIKSAYEVRKEIRNVKYIIYGSVSVPDYYQECLELRDKLELQDTVIFAGHTDNMSAAYQSGDVVVLSSISEAFPYSVVEAMMTGKAVVSTDVGGIREALGETGVLVPPRDPVTMASAVVNMLKNDDLRVSMGREARERALSEFTLDKVLSRHLKSYIKLAVGAHQTPLADATEKTAMRATRLARSHAWIREQQLFVEKGLALAENGFYVQAVQQYRQAISLAPNAPSVPAIIVEVARAYQALGELDLAFNELDKCYALLGVFDVHHTA